MPERERKIRTSCPFEYEGAMSNCKKNCEIYDRDHEACSFRLLPGKIALAVDAFENFTEVLREVKKAIDDLGMNIEQIGLKSYEKY